MPFHVEFTRRAQRDLDRLYTFIHAADSPAAARWFNVLEARILLLESAPRLGALTHEDPVQRQLIHGNKPHLYRVIYRLDESAKRVFILHIRHGRRDKMPRGKSQG